MVVKPKPVAPVIYAPNFSANAKLKEFTKERQPWRKTHIKRPIGPKQQDILVVKK